MRTISSPTQEMLQQALDKARKQLEIRRSWIRVAEAEAQEFSKIINDLKWIAYQQKVEIK